MGERGWAWFDVKSLVLWLTGEDPGHRTAELASSVAHHGLPAAEVKYEGSPLHFLASFPPDATRAVDRAIPQTARCPDRARHFASCQDCRILQQVRFFRDKSMEDSKDGKARCGK